VRRVRGPARTSLIPNASTPNVLATAFLSTPIALSFSSTERRDQGFDRKKQGSAVCRIFDELCTPHIEALRRFVFGLDEHRPDADALRGCRDAARGVRENIGAEPLPAWLRLTARRPITDMGMMSTALRRTLPGAAPPSIDPAAMQK
jgi:hypothetical protein